MSLFLIFVIGSAIWVFFDAREQGVHASPLGWGVATLLVWIVAFPMYLATRKHPIRHQHYAPPTGEPTIR